jgi:hypothetical protein
VVVLGFHYRRHCRQTLVRITGFQLVSLPLLRAPPEMMNPASIPLESQDRSIPAWQMDFEAVTRTGAATPHAVPASTLQVRSRKTIEGFNIPCAQDPVTGNGDHSCIQYAKERKLGVQA